jgi:hypothetical protein
MFSAQKSHGHEVGEPTRPRVRFDAPSHRTILLPMPCEIRVEPLALKPNHLKFCLSRYFKIIQRDSTCFKGFSPRIFFIGFLASENLHPSADNHHPKPILSSVCERLIRVENNLVPTRVPTSHRPQIRPENKGINHSQTVTNQKIYPAGRFVHLSPWTIPAIALLILHFA